MSEFRNGAKVSRQAVVVGTNCGNCRYMRGREVKPPQGFNKQGGVYAPDQMHADMARRADLLTLPGEAVPTKCAICEHPKVLMPVTDRMCCAYWDNPGSLREWRK